MVANDKDLDVFSAQGYLYRNSEITASLLMQHSIIGCSTFCGRCGICQRKSQIVVSSEFSLNISCNVCRDDNRITLKKIHCVFDLDMASEAYLEKFREI